MLRSLTALTTVAALAAVGFVAAPASAQDTTPRIFVSNCEKQVYKPKTITVFCADAGVVINKITYSNYGTKTARGTGTAAVNLCEPNCAAGKTQNFQVRFRLSKPTQCGDASQFRRLRVTYVGAKPPGDRVIRQSFQCADAPTR